MTTRWRQLRTTDRGDMNIEAALGAVALLALLGLGLVGMRIQTADSAVDAAARSAARTASLAHNGLAAARAAEQQARAVLAEQSLTCVSLHVTVDARHYARPPGTGGNVVADVMCEVPYDALLPGLSGIRTVRAEFSSPIDRYGARS
jgi:Flp pilus assembly protein TadG